MVTRALLILVLAAALLGCPPPESLREGCKRSCKCWPARSQQDQCVVGCVVNAGHYTCPEE
jgi:hypothetical protein